MLPGRPADPFTRLISRRKLLSLFALQLAAPQVERAPAAGSGPRTICTFVTQWGRRGKAEGEFDILIGIAINRRDELFVTEFRNNRVQKFDANGKVLAVFPTPDQPAGIAVDRQGNIYVSHLIPGIITVYDPGGHPLRQWGGAGKGDGQFQQPGGIAIAPDGTIYIADEVNRRVQQFTAEGKFLRKWGEYGVGPGQFGGNSPANVRTGGPQFVAVDRHGCVYTTEGSVGRVQKFTADGKYLLSWGDNGTQPGGFGGRPKNLPGPIAIAVDRHDRVWVSATNHRVQQFTNTGELLHVLGEQGSGPGQFITPHGLVFDSKGCLYVCDSQNARVQKFAVHP